MFPDVCNTANQWYSWRRDPGHRYEVSYHLVRQLCKRTARLPQHTKLDQRWAMVAVPEARQCAPSVRRWTHVNSARKHTEDVLFRPQTLREINAYRKTRPRACKSPHSYILPLKRRFSRCRIGEILAISCKLAGSTLHMCPCIVAPVVIVGGVGTALVQTSRPRTRYNF